MESLIVFLCQKATYRTKIEDREGSHFVLDPDQQKWNAENQVHNEKYFLLVDHAFLF